MTVVYHVYLDWTLEVEPRVFYCGKGNDVRVRNRKRNSDWQSIANELGWQREIVFSTKDEDAAYALEKELISKHDTYRGWGANLDPGGRHGGAAGWKMTCESKRRISEANKGRSFSDEHRANLSMAFQGNTNRLGHVPSAEYRAKLSASKLGHKLSEAHRAAIGRGCRGNGCGEENPASKLTWIIVRSIRASTMPSSELAREYGVSIRAVNNVRSFRTWLED